jgi:hypothetical protein
MVQARSSKRRNSPTLKMKDVCTSETSVDFHRAIRNYIPEDRSLYGSDLLQMCGNFTYDKELQLYRSVSNKADAIFICLMNRFTKFVNISS